MEGRQAVRELLLAGIRPTHEVVIAAGQNHSGALAQIMELAAELRVPVKELAKGKFESMTVTEAPQGVMARAAPLREHDLDDLARSAGGRPPFLLVLDGVTDPGNVGAALRTAECAGVTGAVLGRHRAAHITPTAAKAAAGAIEHVPMAVVPGIPNALARLAELGVWTVGLDVAAPTTVYEISVASQKRWPWWWAARAGACPASPASAATSWPPSPSPATSARSTPPPPWPSAVSKWPAAAELIFRTSARSGEGRGCRR